MSCVETSAAASPYILRLCSVDSVMAMMDELMSAKQISDEKRILDFVRLGMQI